MITWCQMVSVLPGGEREQHFYCYVLCISRSLHRSMKQVDDSWELEVVEVYWVHVCLSGCIEGSQKIVLEVGEQAKCRPEYVTGDAGNV